MKRKNINKDKFKLSGILTGLFSLCTVGITLYLVNQNNKILKLLNSSDVKNMKAEITEDRETPMGIHRSIIEENELPAKRRFLTG